MIIDMHTHIFPESIASRAIASLEKKADAGSGAHMTAQTDGTYNGLLKSMTDFGIDVSLVLPVMTKPSQFESVNEYASSINGGNGIYSFGGMHPDCENKAKKLAYVKSLGLKGIKLHPDYQGCFVNDPRYVEIVTECLKLGLYVTFHAGYDVGYPEPMYCQPEMFESAYRSILTEASKKDEIRVILAHLGGVTTPERTLRSLCGLPVYLDMAYTLGLMRDDDIVRVIRDHGAERVIFGSDSPWTSQGEGKRRLFSLPLTDEEKALISHKNAERILGIF